MAIADKGYDIRAIAGQALVVQLKAENFGRTPAFAQSVIAKMTVDPINAQPVVFDNYGEKEAPSSEVIFPGTTETLTTDTAHKSDDGSFLPPLDDAAVTDTRSGKLEVFVYGSIWYRDSFDAKHRTDYCFKYQADAHRTSGISQFAACKRHNYAD